MLASIIIRTLNEAKHLGSLLSAIKQQRTDGLDTEIVVVDSGSTDGTLAIAQHHCCRILHIERQNFSFGRSLNMGCEAANGDILVMISGHCIPTSDTWLQALCQPLIDNIASYSYGRQIGNSESRYSECRIFAKYYPEQSKIPQDGYFCNNANAAITRSAWQKFRFDEALTGLEDMELALRLTQDHGKIAYVADACVYHLHSEDWKAVKRRFEREAIALQKIMPQVHIHKLDLIRYIASSIVLDFRAALADGVLLQKAVEIVQYRVCQYLGSYVGNHDHRVLSNAQKEEYFYPSESRKKDGTADGRIATHES